MNDRRANAKTADPINNPFLTVKLWLDTQE